MSKDSCTSTHLSLPPRITCCWHPWPAFQFQTSPEETRGRAFAPNGFRTAPKGKRQSGYSWSERAACCPISRKFEACQDSPGRQQLMTVQPKCDSNTKPTEQKLLTSTNYIYWIICTRQNDQNSVQKPVQAAWIQLLVSYMLSRGITKFKALYYITWFLKQ